MPSASSFEGRFRARDKIPSTCIFKRTSQYLPRTLNHIPLGEVHEFMKTLNDASQWRLSNITCFPLDGETWHVRLFLVEIHSQAVQQSRRLSFQYIVFIMSMFGVSRWGTFNTAITQKMFPWYDY